MADPGEESDDDHHNETVGHHGNANSHVVIPYNALIKKATLQGVTEDTLKTFYGNPTNRKKFYVVTDATTTEQQEYPDVLLFPFIPEAFMDWLLEKQRTPFEFYSYVLNFISNIDDPTLKAKCQTVCQPMLNWCLCSCVKEKETSKAPITQLTPQISAIFPSKSCSRNLAARLAATTGSGQPNNDGGGLKRGDDLTDILKACVENNSKVITMFGNQQKQAQPGGNKSTAEKDDSGWSDFQWEQAAGFCGVDDVNDIPVLLQKVVKAKKTELAGLVQKAMVEEAADMGVTLAPFYLSSSRLEDIKKGLFSPGARATITDLKSGIVILDLVERSSAEVATFQSQEQAEFDSERNRSLDESREIARLHKQNVGAVPDNVPDAKQTITHYVVLLRVLFGKKCPHYQELFEIKQMVDAWNKESVTPEMIKNLFWAIIVDARQFFFAWAAVPPTSNLRFTIDTYKAGQYTRIVTLPLAWRDATPNERGGGTGGGNPGGNGRGGDQGRKPTSPLQSQSVNTDMHPMIAELMKPYKKTFKRFALRVVCKEAKCTMAELPKFRTDGKDGCVNFALGYCGRTAAGEGCDRRHLPKQKVSKSDAESLCSTLRPGIEAMIENKDKFKHMGLQE
ncbi:hypothetical protein ACHAWC_011010 [Mediolabrus comicus]